MNLFLIGLLAGLVVISLVTAIALVRRSSRRADKRVADLIKVTNLKLE